MEYDPILKEVHAIKDRIAREVGHDAHKLAERLKKTQDRYAERVVRPIPGEKTRGKARIPRQLP